MFVTSSPIRYITSRQIHNQLTKKDIENKLALVTTDSIYGDCLAQAKHGWFLELVMSHWEFVQRCHVSYLRFQYRCKVYCIYGYSILAVPCAVFVSCSLFLCYVFFI